jgi:diguanylate cyclase (GGDEF)-like protein/PAS domain S-box-containing protein
MKPKSSSPEDTNREISALMETLLNTGQRLEELTDGQVDTVADRDGRTLLLRGTQEQLKKSEDIRQAAILNALPAQIALLDATGMIVSVNEAWSRFVSENVITRIQGRIGLNYLEICDRARACGSYESHLAAEGIRSVLSGEEKSFSLEYRCDSDPDQRWFELMVSPLSEQRQAGAVIMLLDITNRKQADSAHQLLTERLSLATAVARVGVWEWDLATDFLTWDSTMFGIYGLTPIVPMTYQKWVSTVHPEDLPSIEAIVRRVIDQKCQEAAEFRIVTEGGTVRNTAVVLGVVLDGSGNVSRLIGVNMDITERKDAEEKLLAEKESAQVRLNSIGDSVFCTDMSHNINFLNSVAERMTGWSFEEAKNRPIVEILRIEIAVSGELIPMESAVGENQTVQLPPDGVFVRRDGVKIPIEGSVAPIRDREGRHVGAVIVVRDVSAARAMTLQMTHQAEHDSLTGLPNRFLLTDRTKQAIVTALRDTNRIALLFLDLDGFKHINDSLGHAVGDKLLQSIAKRLLSCMRASDTVSRQGGDEFIVLLSEIGQPEDVAIAARRILAAVAEPHSVDLHELHVTVSIGLSVYPDDGLDAETLVKNADTAMYQAKESGHHSYQFFKPAMNVRAVERQSIEEGLRRGLERGEFMLHYQPKINLRTGEITGAEALMRWTHPTRGPISPAQFIPVAEDCGLILPIGNWVLREACKQARAWADSCATVPTISVNVSAIEFRQENFLENLFEILNETGLDPRALELELTETVLMKRAESAASTLQKMRVRGIQIAVDDFGTGYSSLSYLRKFPIDALKIDRSFVQQITMTPDDTTIVAAIISMGRSMKLRVIAEGVETQAELEFLQRQHCDEAQGYYFSRPVSAHQFAILLETGIRTAAVFEPTSRFKVG